MVNPPNTVERTRFLFTQKAAVKMVSEHPFFSSLLLPIPFVEVGEDGIAPNNGLKVEGMAIDGKHLYYNPHGWLRTFDLEEMKLALLHEAMHLVLNHNLRQRHREPGKWNVAIDHEANLYLKAAGHTIPHDWCCDSHYDGMPAEKIYDLLPDMPPSDDPKQQPGQGQGQGQGGGQPPPGGQPQGGGQPNPNDLSGNRPPMPDLVQLNQKPGPQGGQMSETQAKQEMQTNLGKLVAAEQAAKRRGKMPANIAEMIRGLLKPKLDWRKLLQDFAAQIFPSEFSWTRINPKFDDDIIMPGFIKDGTGTLVLAIDTSASVNEKELKQFGGECAEIINNHRPAMTYVIYCDAQVHRVDEITPGDEFELNVVGRGGTNFEPVFNWVRENGIDPHGLIYLTDMECSFPEAPPYPVLWVSSTAINTAPFGTVVNLDKQEAA